MSFVLAFNKILSPRTTADMRPITLLTFLYMYKTNIYYNIKRLYSLTFSKCVMLCKSYPLVEKRQYANRFRTRGGLLRCRAGECIFIKLQDSKMAAFVRCQKWNFEIASNAAYSTDLCLEIVSLVAQNVFLYLRTLKFNVKKT